MEELHALGIVDFLLGLEDLVVSHLGTDGERVLR